MKNFTSLFIAAIISLMSNVPLFGQHTPTPVVPGSKGVLPSVPSVSAGDGSVLPLLSLRRIYTYVFNFGGTYYTPMIECEFPPASTLGGDYYVVEMLKGREWVDRLYQNDEPYQNTGYNFSLKMDPVVRAYRLKVVGGPKDGMYSNIIPCQYPRVMTSFGSGYTTPSYNNRIGYTEDAPYIREVKVGGEAVDDFKPYVRYRWYRRNPNTFELTQIEGATEEKYTYTLEDVGYDIVAEICGDGDHLDFCVRKEVKNISIPLICSLEYSHTDGAILNTDYILPHAEDLYIGWNTYENGKEKWVDYECSTQELKPGQYMIRKDPKVMDYIIRAKGGVIPFFTLSVPWYDEPMYREVEVQLGYRPSGYLNVQNGSQETPVVDVMHINLDGEVVVDTTIVCEENMAEIKVIPCKYYVRTHATAHTLATYHPSAMRWEDAEPVSVPMFNMATGKDSLFVLTNLDKPVPLTGQGVIEGRVSRVQAAPAPRRVLRADGMEVQAVTVLLLDDKGGLVATTTPSDNGIYRFENVPFGTYAVVVDALGYSAEASSPVCVSTEQPIVSNVNYSLTDDGRVVTTGVTSLRARQNAVLRYDLQGRRIHQQPKQAGLYIVNGRKVIL